MQTPQQYTAKQIADALGVNLTTINRRSNREDWPFSKRSGRGGGKMFSPENLPADVRRVLAVVAAGALAESGHGAVAVPSGVGIAAGAVPPEQYHQAGLDRYAVVHAWRAHVIDAGWGQKGKATEGFLFAFNAGQILPHIHARLGAVAVATLYAWDKKLKNHDDNYLILCDRNGVWTEGKAPELGQIGYEAEEVFLRCWLHPNRPSYRLAYRATCAILKDRGHETVPGYHSFYRFAKRYEKTNRDVVVLARDGEKALKDQVLSYISRDHAALRVGQCLVADGHDLNFEVLHPVTGRPARLKLILFYDWASNLPVGWQIMPTEDSVAISAAFRAACLRLGRYPEVLYLDNGKAFKAKVFHDTSPDLRELHGLYARLGVRCQFAAPYNARAKVIERWFHTFDEQCESLIPTYCGSSINTKPAWRNRNEKFHKAWHDAKTKGWMPTLRDAANIIELYVRWYAHQPHEGLGGRLPIDVFEAGRGPGVDVADLNYHMLWTKRIKRVRNCRVTLYGVEYEADCLQRVGGAVLAKYDTADLSTIHLYTEDRLYLGEAKPVEAIHPLAALFGDAVGVDRLKFEMKRQRSQAKQAKTALRELGASPDAIESGLAYLPNLQKSPVMPSTAPAPASESKTPSMNDEQQARLAAVAARIAAGDMDDDEPIHARPAYFASSAGRYEWCVRHVEEFGLTLTDEDAAFMIAFENAVEFERYRDGFEDLRQMIALKKKVA